jgi:hypothetical protein
MDAARDASSPAPRQPTRHAAGEDPHLTWDIERRALAARASSAEVDDDTQDELMEDLCALEDRILTTPALSLAGMVTQLRLLVHYLDLSDDPATCGAERDGCRNAITTLERLIESGAE